MTTTRARTLLHSLFAAFAALLFLVPRSSYADDTQPDLGTPRRAVASFLDAAERGDFDLAARALDFDGLPLSRHPEQRREAARQLYVVLGRVTWVELPQISDDPKGRPEDGDDKEILATARVDNRSVSIALARRDDAGVPSWRFSTATVSLIPKLYEEHGPGPIERRMPEALREPRVWGLAPWQWIAVPVAVAVAFALGALLAWIGAAFASRLAARTPPKLDDELVAEVRGPARFFFAALLLHVLFDQLSLTAAALHVLSRFVSMMTILTVAWTAIRVVSVVARWVETSAKAAAAGAGDAELRARGIATQVRVLRRVGNVAIGIVALALMLTQFELVRNIGMSLLASAGLAGVVLGFAAQRTIGSLIAGIQLSATQPIRIGDVVIVEKEWGVIEEITLTYVVVRVWDERRLIVPMTRFLEQPFENWTKTSAQLHGTVYFHADYTLPVDEVRKELARILDGHEKWDGRTKGVVVTDAKDRTLEVRILVSASDSGKLWDLRVDVREKIIRWLQEFEGGRYLPRIRWEEREPGK